MYFALVSLPEERRRDLHRQWGPFLEAHPLMVLWASETPN